MRSRRARNSASSEREASAPAAAPGHRPPAGAQAAGRSGRRRRSPPAAAGSSVREKDLPEDDQIALVRLLLPIARRNGARLTLHGDAALAKAAGADGVHVSAARRRGGEPQAARPRQADRRLDPHRDRGGGGRSRHCRLCDCRAGLRDREQAGLWTGDRRARAWPISPRARACRWWRSAASMPRRAAEVLAAGVSGIAVMGSIMRAADPGQETKALLATVAGAVRSVRVVHDLVREPVPTFPTSPR